MYRLVQSTFFRLRIQVGHWNDTALAPSLDPPGVAPGAALLPREASVMQGRPDRIGADCGNPSAAWRNVRCSVVSDQAAVPS